MNKYQTKDKCSLCVEYYEIEIRAPKVLKCGHTFCQQCLIGLVAYLLKCPICGEPIEEPVKELPTNYALFSLIPTNDPNELELKKKSLFKLLDEQNEHASKHLQILTQSGDKLSNIIETLEQLIIIIEDNDHELENDLSEIEESLLKIQLKLYSCHKLEIKPSFTLSNYPTKEEFICEIVVEIFKKTNVYAFHSEWYNKKNSWGKLSYKDGKLYIHTFTPDLPIYPYLFVPFRDLKKCMTMDNFRTFIDIDEDHLVCTLLTSSNQTKIFTKLCSGEEGISLKGLKSRIKIFPNQKRQVAEIEDAGKQNIFNDDYEFLSSLPSKADEIFYDNLLQIRMRNERFEIVKSQNISSVEVVPDEVIIASAPTNESMFSSLCEIESCIENSGILIILPINQSIRKLNLCNDFKLALLRESINRPISKPISRIVSLEDT